MKLTIKPEVAEALANNDPVVALESTVIAHGLPYPKNIETARELESIVREAGAVPATIAIFDGEILVGLDEHHIERLATENNIRKISRRDLPIAVGKKLNCATTVATTSLLAHSAGIKVFATGGIGGVHRGYSADVSADLPELAQTPIVVVCSGAKIVLDLPATREWLETFGVTVLGWQCDEMPAFYARSSGLAVDERINTAEELAKIVSARDDLGLKNAILLNVPVPEEFAMDRDELERLIADSLIKAEKKNISGKAITPFLLAELAAATEGRSVTTNIELLKENARVAAQIAAKI